MTSADVDCPAPARNELAAGLEAAGWSVFLIWVGASLIADLSWGIFFFGTGLLMLGTQALRRRLGLRLDRFSMALGACFVVVGGLRALDWRLDEFAIPGWVVPALFIAVGAALVASAWKRRPKP